MTRQEHKDIGDKHRRLAIQAIKSFGDTLDWKYWREYIAESKLANKHHGIAQAMYTRELNRRA